MEPRYKKSSDLKDFLQGSFIANGNCDYKVVKGDELINNTIEEAVQTSENVGVYLICHGCGRRPSVFGAQSSTNRVMKWDMNEVGTAIAKLLQSIGLKSIRKICLLMCGRESDGDDRFVCVLSKAIKNLNGTAPLIAGYDSYVTVIEGGTKKIGAELGIPSQVTSTKEQLLNKFKAVCLDGSSEATTLMASGWSDKPLLLETQNDKCKCVII